MRIVMVFFIAENLPQVEEEEDIQMQEIITESSNDFLYLNEGDDITKEEEQPSKKSDEREENGSVEVDEMSLELLNGQFVNEEEEEEEAQQQSQNGAEAYENLVKSLTECDNGENNFSLIDGNMLETIYSREGLFQ